jgi:hypothetical protein
MSPRLPPDGAGCPDDADFPEDPLRISPERTTPASTGNIFFRIFELTPEKFCA